MGRGKQRLYHPFGSIGSALVVSLSNHDRPPSLTPSALVLR